jgi:hypothetical protein
MINAREVMADCVSPDAESLLGFKVCGRKVVPPHAPGGRQKVKSDLCDMKIRFV